MKNHLRVLAVFIPLFTFGLVEESPAAGKEGEWVRIPSKWLLRRFVRPSTAPARTYKIALAMPPGAKQATVVKSSGNPDVDTLAADFAMESILGNPTLKGLAKSKELYFQFVVTPPMLDVKMRSKDGLRPMSPGKELYMPSSPTIFTDPNHNTRTTRDGKLAVIFPPQGGYASAAIITVSTGNPSYDGYFVHNAALNWQTSSKSSQDQVIHQTVGVVAPQRWESILDR